MVKNPWVLLLEMLKQVDKELVLDGVLAKTNGKTVEVLCFCLLSNVIFRLLQHHDYG